MFGKQIMFEIQHVYQILMGGFHSNYLILLPMQRRKEIAR